jgi:hypothetical protein
MVGIPAEDLTVVKIYALSLNPSHEYEDHVLVYCYSVNRSDSICKDKLFESYPGTNYPRRGSS